MCVSERENIGIVWSKVKQGGKRKSVCVWGMWDNLSLDFQLEYVLGNSNLLILGEIPLGVTHSARFASLNSTSFFESLLLKYLNESVLKRHIHFLFTKDFKLVKNVIVNSVIGGICDDTLSVTRSVILSPTWDVLLNHTLQESDNLYAEVWMRRLGVDSNGA